ncbi:MAG: GNAT family N-acetyltransferase [Asgard group archaeon]|nr:GNAT family N-acetyltransferase [Asgard group archaeon]
MRVILRNPTKQEIIRAIEENIFEYRKWYSKRIKGIEIIENDEYYLFNSGLEFGFANFVLNVRISEEIEPKIKQLCSYFQERNLPFHVLISPNSKPANIEDKLTNYGLILRFQEPGMACNLKNFEEKPIQPEGIEASLVSDLKGMNDWNKIRKIVYNFPKELDEDSFLFHVHELEGRAYVAYSNKTPVAVSLSYYGSGVAGIYSVATLPDHRQRGIGKYLTLLLLEDAKRAGYELVILQSSTMGINIYRKLGFKKYCDMRFFTWKLDDIS